MRKMKKEKLFWISAANVFACLGVIILHANGVFWSFPRGRLWYTANFLETFFYWPVPIFFMLSGATLIDYRERYSTTKYFSKRIQRTLIPFLVWSIFSLIYRRLISGWQLGSPREIISGICNTRYNVTYWFFIPLFAVYLGIPLLSAIPKKDRINLFGYLSAATFLFTSVLPTAFALLNLQYNTAIQVPVTAGYVLYVLLGYLIKNVDLDKPIRFTLYGLAILGWFVQFQGTNLLSLSAGQLVRTFKGYLNFPAVMQAVGIMVFFKYFPWEKVLHNFGQKLIINISRYTFGIYLIHYYLVEQVPLWFSINTDQLWWRTIGALIVFIIATAICWVLSKIPVLKKSIGF